MARGRMVSATIGESRKLAALANHTHRLIYLMVLPSVDKAGRFEADPIVIKSKCLMRLDVELSTIEAWLEDAVRTNLLRVYEAKGVRVLEIVDFLKYNTPHYKEPDSKLPAPEEGTPCYTQKSNVEPSMTQSRADVKPTLPIREVKERELEREEKKTLVDAEIAESPRELAATPPRASHDPGLFLEAWNANRGRLPAATALNGKRRTMIRGLVKEHGESEALALFTDATRAIAGNEFYITKRYGIDILLAGKVLKYAEQWRSVNTEPSRRVYENVSGADLLEVATWN